MVDRMMVGYGNGGIASINVATGRKVADIRLTTHPEGFRIDPKRDHADDLNPNEDACGPSVKGGATFFIEHPHKNGGAKMIHAEGHMPTVPDGTADFARDPESSGSPDSRTATFLP
jgi:hypothetical protein